MLRSLLQDRAIQKCPYNFLPKIIFGNFSLISMPSMKMNVFRRHFWDEVISQTFHMNTKFEALFSLCLYRKFYWKKKLYISLFLFVLSLFSLKDFVALIWLTIISLGIGRNGPIFNHITMRTRFKLIQICIHQYFIKWMFPKLNVVFFYQNLSQFDIIWIISVE